MGSIIIKFKKKNHEMTDIMCFDENKILRDLSHCRKLQFKEEVKCVCYEYDKKNNNI